MVQNKSEVLVQRNNVSPALAGFLSHNLTYCLKAVNARSGSIFLLDKDKKELVLGISQSPHRQRALTGMRLRLGERITGKVAVERKPLLVSNTDTMSFKLRPRYNHYRSKSFLSVPLEFSRNLIGVVNITDKPKGALFDEHDLKAVMMISQSISAAIFSFYTYLHQQVKTNEEYTRELARLKKSIEESAKLTSLGKLVGSLAHEINNPLDGVMRFVSLALECTDDDNAGVEYLKEARCGLTRIAQTIRSLLDFSWSLSAHKGYIDVNHVLEESLAGFGTALAAGAVIVKKDLAEGLPRLRDYGLGLVLNNIIKNAIEAMKAGGKLSITTKHTMHTITIRIQDTGTGIAPSDLKKIFDPFFTTKRIGEGSGLGLAISGEIITRYNGTLSVTSREGVGTTFSIRIPSRYTQKKAPA